MQHLPTAEEQDWLVQTVADLVGRCGHAPFVSMPIVEPTQEFFPDRWSFSHASIERLTRRLMQYAGLDLDIELLTFVDVARQSRDKDSRGCESIAAAFLGIENGRCRLAFNTENAGDAEFMGGVMSHEVAHVYRTFHGLKSPSPELEELATDVTTVYLGFGILTANANYRFRTFGSNVGYVSTYAWSTRRAGYLTPQAFSYLIAMQLVARGVDSKDRRRLLKHLETNQAAFAASALDHLEESSESLHELLKLPPRREWVPEISRDRILKPLPDIEERLDESEASDVRKFNTGQKVYREKSGGLTHILGPMGGLAGFVFAVSQDLSPLGTLAAVGIGLFLSVYLSSLNSTYRCSDSKCRQILSPLEDVCPRCGGIIAGLLKNDSDRFQDEE